MTARFTPILLLLLLVHAGHAQVQLQADRKQIHPGQPITLQITVQSNRPDSLLPPASLAPLELLQRTPAVITQNDKGWLSTQQWVITSFDSGKMTLPALASAGGLRSLADTFLVTQMPADSLKGYSEPKAYFPQTLPEQWPYKLALLAATLLSGYLLWRKLRGNKAMQEQRRVEKLARPAAWQKEMKLLQSQWKEGNIKAVPAAARLMLLLKALMQQAGADTAALTGKESLAMARNYFANNEHDALAQAVDHCYEVLFGRYRPESEELMQHMRQTEQAAQSFFDKAKRSAAS